MAGILDIRISFAHTHRECWSPHFDLLPLSLSLSISLSLSLFKQVTNKDWEDISVSECRGLFAESGSCIFVADIGNNNDPSNVVKVIQVKEPDTVADATYFIDDEETRYTVLSYYYSDGGAPDAEALVTFGDSVYIFTKLTNGSTVVWKGSLTAPGELQNIDIIVRGSTNQRHDESKNLHFVLFFKKKTLCLVKLLFCGVHTFFA